MFVTLVFTCPASTLFKDSLDHSLCCFWVIGPAGCSPCGTLSALDKAHTSVVR